MYFGQFFGKFFILNDDKETAQHKNGSEYGNSKLNLSLSFYCTSHTFI